MYPSDTSPLSTHDLPALGLQLLHRVIAVYRSGRTHALDNDVMHAPLEALREVTCQILEHHHVCEFHLYGTVFVLNGAIGTPDLALLGVVREVSSRLNDHGVGGFRFRSSPTAPDCLALVASLLEARVGVDPQHHFEVIQVKVIAELLERLHLQEIENLRNRDAQRWSLELYVALLKILRRGIDSLQSGGEVRNIVMTGRILRELIDVSAKAPSAVLQLALLRDERLPYLQRHLANTTLLAILVALELRLPRGEVLLLARVALFHELGIAVYGQHLEELGQELSPTDRQLVQDLPLLSARMHLRHEALDFDALRSVIAAIECKRGFDDPMVPPGMEAVRRPMTTVSSRVVQVCSAFDALTSERRYRAALPVVDAIEAMQAGHLRYDPRVVTALIRVLSGVGHQDPAVAPHAESA
ncbi:MAG: HD-GYP domain-containing protein [Myxococcota bacterium]